MNANAKTDAGKPFSIKRGNVIVKIYTHSDRSKGREYVQYTLSYYSGNRRVRQTFGDFEEARRAGEFAAVKLASGESEALKLTGQDRALYVQAVQDLARFNIPLNVAVKEFTTALETLPAGVTVREAVAFFVKRHPAGLDQRTVRAVVEELIAAKRQAGRSELHVNDLVGRLNRFADAFQTNIGNVTGQMIQKHLDGLNVAGRTQRNHLRIITSLFQFAVRRKYLPKDALEELEAIEKPEVAASKTLIFTPAELREMLLTARPEIVPQLAIAAFCGIRSAEISRLDWAQVNLERRFVEVTAANAKTASRRLVPLCDAAIAWLTPCRKSEGAISYYSEENKFCGSIVARVNAARKAAGKEPSFRWKQNGLRHGFCSYRMAITSDAAKTALEAGNSPAMIFKHYRELVTEDEAKAWFEILPTKELTNVVPMRPAT